MRPNNNQNQNQNRGRGRNNNNNNNQNRGRGRGGQSSNNRTNFDSNGPGVRIRGSASQVYDKYAGMARDAQTSGDPVVAETLFQHAEHYYRIAAEQEAAKEARNATRPNNNQRRDRNAPSKDENQDGDDASIDVDDDNDSDDENDAPEAAVVEARDGPVEEPTDEAAEEVIEKPKPRKRAPRKPKVVKEAEAEVAE